MKQHLILATLALGLSGTAWAEDVDDLEAESTLSGSRTSKPVMEDSSEVSASLPKEEDSNRPYSSRAYEGARVLQMDAAFVQDVISAADLLFQRDYSGALKAFEEAGQRWPHSGLAPVGKVLVYQAKMLEDMDFQYEAQYELASKRARQQLMEAMEIPGNEAWEAFILGGVLGVDAIHNMRKGNYLTSLNRGLQAMGSINRSQELAPEFPDPLLGDGLYNYWRTVISRSTRGLPSFKDKRKLGIQQMQQIEKEGIFLGPAATFALTYTWLEEGALKRSMGAALRNQKRYPDNIVNNILVGRLYMYRRKYAKSELNFKKVLKTSPKNEKVHYYMGRLYLRTKQLARAEQHFDKYLGFEIPESSRSYALYAKGLVYYRRKDLDAAENYVNQAWKLGKLKRAKKRLEKIQKLRDKEGG
jgi:tetratricopeptide (TPR) repeat protein